MVRSVRGAVGQWMAERPCPGYYSAFLEFEDGTPATLVHNGYGYFLASELVPWGVDRPRMPLEHRIRFRNELRAGTLDEGIAKESLRFGGEQADAPDFLGDDRERRANQREWVPADPGLFIVSCERGDIRQSPQGLFIYDDDGMRDAPIQVPGISYNNEIDEMYDAVMQDRLVYHDGRWGMATLEVCLAIMESARDRKEVRLTHQTPTYDLASIVSSGAKHLRPQDPNPSRGGEE